VRNTVTTFKTQFKETEGEGSRNEGLGIVGRPCTFEFVKAKEEPKSPASSSN